MPQDMEKDPLLLTFVSALSGPPNALIFAVHCFAWSNLSWQVQRGSKQCSDAGNHTQHSVCAAGLFLSQGVHTQPLPGVAEQVHHFAEEHCDQLPARAHGLSGIQQQEVSCWCKSCCVQFVHSCILQV